MRRFTDPILFFVLSIVTTVVWWIAAAAHSYPDVPVGYLTPMTVVVFCVVATPALLTVTLLALCRAIFNVEPRGFWAWITGTAVVGTVLTAIANGITDVQEVQVGFSTTAWFLGVLAGAGLIALVLALTGAVPSGDDAKFHIHRSKKDENGGDSPAKKQRKRHGGLGKNGRQEPGRTDSATVAEATPGAQTLESDSPFGAGSSSPSEPAPAGGGTDGELVDGPETGGASVEDPDDSAPTIPQFDQEAR